MKFILKLVMSSAYFLPSSVSFTPFESKEYCERALTEAKKSWVVVERESKCVDLEKQDEIKKLKQRIKDLQ